MDGFDGKHADYETSHERADYGTISQLEVYEVTGTYGDDTSYGHYP
mgnify:FL=1